MAVTGEPDPHGYMEFRRRLDEARLGRAQLPPLDGTTESQWIDYLSWHCVGNPPTRDGYKEFRRRIDLAYLYRYDPRAFAANYSGKPNLDINTIPPAFDASSSVGEILREFLWHIAGNPEGERGYRELHRRIATEVFPRAEATIRGLDTPAAKWTFYLTSHLKDNKPVIEINRKPAAIQLKGRYIEWYSFLKPMDVEQAVLAFHDLQAGRHRGVKLVGGVDIELAGTPIDDASGRVSEVEVRD